MGILWSIGAFILILSPIVIVHEFGHFWTAKKFGIKVDEFGLGFPPRAVKLFEKDGTVYSLNWIPLGGFVRPAGEDDPNVPGGLAAASKTARFCTLAAGAFFNFVFAFFILWGAFLLGPLEIDDSVVAAVGISPDSVAEAAGITPNDVFVSANGVVIGDDMTQLQTIVGDSLGEPVDLVLSRDGQLIELTAIPQAHPDTPERGILGVGLGGIETGERQHFSMGAAAQESLTMMWRVVSLTISAPKMLLDGTLSPQEARPISPIGISQIAASQAQTAFSTGEWFGLLWFAGIINVGLGFTNLLPLPALDGGRILFVILEAIRGRRIAPEREGFVHMVGMLLLLSLLVFLMIQDVINPVIPF